MDQWLPIIRILILPAGALVISGCCYLLIIRPLLRASAAKAAQAEKNGAAPREAARPGRTGSDDFPLPRSRRTDLEKIALLARSDPDRASRLVREWLHERD